MTKINVEVSQQNLIFSELKCRRCEIFMGRMQSFCNSTQVLRILFVNCCHCRLLSSVSEYTSTSIDAFKIEDTDIIRFEVGKKMSDDDAMIRCLPLACWHLSRLADIRFVKY